MRRIEAAVAKIENILNKKALLLPAILEDLKNTIQEVFGDKSKSWKSSKDKEELLKKDLVTDTARNYGLEPKGKELSDADLQAFVSKLIKDPSFYKKYLSIFQGNLS